MNEWRLVEGEEGEEERKKRLRLSVGESVIQHNGSGEQQRD